MAEGTALDVPHSSNVVTGRRVKFWQAPGWLDIEGVFKLASPLLIVWAVYWEIGRFRRPGHLLDDDNIGGTIIGIPFGLIMLLVGIIGAVLLRNEFRDWMIDSACPVCGATALRTFPLDTAAEPASSVECGSCTAYLRATGPAVREEALEATGFYSLHRVHYVSVVRHEGEHLRFDMPAMCAHCGALPTTTVEIADADKLSSGGGGGVLGDIASFAGRELVNDTMPTRYSDGLHHPTTSSEPDPAKVAAAEAAKALNEELAGIQVPVCEAHADGGVFRASVYRSSGLLYFCSYRYYRAFAAANGIQAKPSLLPMPPGLART
jgi:hypothetical protein